jgi:NAD(P) transhydrogenase subunit beta
MSTTTLVNLVYILSAITFILGFKMLSSPLHARKGNIISAVGMASAIAVTLLVPEIATFQNIVIGAVIGSVIGAMFAYMTPMTGMPQMVGLLNGFGGLASLLVAWSEFYYDIETTGYRATVLFITAIIGAVTFSGSVIAWAKLEEKYIPTRPVLFKGQYLVNLGILLVAIVLGIIFATDSANGIPLFIAITALCLILGVLLVIPIGGADMPVVICLLNSYSGMAACASGFVVINNLLIVAGALVGASGIILTLIMCKAMNRSVANVFLGGFGATGGAASKATGDVKSVKADEAYLMLEAASSVVFVPGYGLAVSQAQHVVRELGELLEKNGADVRYAIHPVAGRMPGHMNVLLAEANVSYEHLVEMENVNPIMETVDVAIVVGANDVVNPAAKEDKNSPLWGMPIIEVDRARTVIVLKRSMNTGFAGVDNPLFFKTNTRMLFGDAKASIQAVVNEFKGSS